MQNPDLTHLVETIRKQITPDIVIYAPPHMTYKDFSGLGEYEYMQVYVGDRHDRNFVFLGDTAYTIGQTSVEL